MCNQAKNSTLFSNRQSNVWTKYEKAIFSCLVFFCSSSQIGTFSTSTVPSARCSPIDFFFCLRYFARRDNTVQYVPSTVYTANLPAFSETFSLFLPTHPDFPPHRAAIASCVPSSPTSCFFPHFPHQKYVLPAYCTYFSGLRTFATLAADSRILRRRTGPDYGR